MKYRTQNINHKKYNIRKLFLISVVCMLVIVPFILNAQEQDEESKDEGVILLAPSLFDNKDVYDVDNEGKKRVTDLGKYLNGVFLLGIGIASGLAVIYIAVGGIQYMMTSAAGGKEAGREKITGAVGGLILALASFAILNTINPDLLEFNIEKTIDNIVAKINKDQDLETLDAPDFWNWKLGNVAREALKAKTDNRVRVKLPECSYIGDGGCASIWGINQRFYDEAKKLADQCDCEIITITSGTDYWFHTGGKDLTSEEKLDFNKNPTKHKKYNAVVDIRADSWINDYIMDETPDDKNDPIPSTQSLECLEKVERNGVNFQWESGKCTGSSGDHWHVEF